MNDKQEQKIEKINKLIDYEFNELARRIDEDIEVKTGGVEYLSFDLYWNKKLRAFLGGLSRKFLGDDEKNYYFKIPTPSEREHENFYWIKEGFKKYIINELDLNPKKNNKPDKIISLNNFTIECFISYLVGILTGATIIAIL